MEIDRRMVRKAINETLADSNIKPVNPNELLFQHAKYIRQLEEKLAAQQKLMCGLEERLGFAEQLAREAHGLINHPKFQEMVDNADKASHEAADLAKLCLALAKKLKK